MKKILKFLFLILTIIFIVKSPANAKALETYKSSTFYYEQLEGDEKIFYEEVKASLNKYLAGDITPAKINTDYCSEWLYLHNLEPKRASKIIELVEYDNPQFFFLSTQKYYYEGKICYCVYEDFNNPEKLQNAKTKLEDSLDEFSKGISKQDRKRTISKKILKNIKKEKVSYNYDALNCDWNSFDDPMKTQSVYSAAVDKNTVCTGYSKLYMILANRFGLKSICVRNKTHCWCLTNINKKWYNTDITFAIDYSRYLLCTNKKIEHYDKELKVPNQHVLNYWKNVKLPRTKNTYLTGDDNCAIIYL